MKNLPHAKFRILVLCGGIPYHSSGQDFILHYIFIFFAWFPFVFFCRIASRDALTHALFKFASVFAINHFTLHNAVSCFQDRNFLFSYRPNKVYFILILDCTFFYSHILIFYVQELSCCNKKLGKVKNF